jgi:hypothetical protein
MLCTSFFSFFGLFLWDVNNRALGDLPLVCAAVQAHRVIFYTCTCYSQVETVEAERPCLGLRSTGFVDPWFMM